MILESKVFLSALADLHRLVVSQVRDFLSTGKVNESTVLLFGAKVHVSLSFHESVRFLSLFTQEEVVTLDT